MQKKFSLLLLLLAVLASSIGMAQAQDPITFIFGRPADSVSMDSAIITDSESFRPINQGCQGLTTFEGSTTNVIGDLAESWTPSEDGLTWVFKLREGVTFHDGTPFNAEAVKFNFDRWRLSASPYRAEGQVFEYYEYMFAGFDDASIISDVQASGEFEVTFTLKEPNAPLLNNLAMNSFFIHSPAAIQEFGADYGTPNVGYVCTGPYQFVSWTPGETIVLERYEGYWHQLAGNVERIIIRTIEDNAARFAALQAGEIDALEAANIEDIADLTVGETADSIYLLLRPAFNTQYLAFNYQIQEFQDARVRRALSLAINREAIVDAFFGEFGEVANNFIPPLVWGHDDSLVSEYDPEAARALLAEAGFAEGLSEVTLADGSKIPLVLFYMPVVRFYNPDPEGIAQAQAADLAAVGITVELQTAGDWPTYLGQRAEGQLVGLYQLGWGGDNGDPDNFLGYFFAGSEPKPSEGFYDNAELRELLNEARVLPTQAERLPLYQQAEQLLASEAGRIWIAHQQTPLAFGPQVSGYVVNPLSQEFYQNVTVTR
jgi:peptide/nickel transport system substrate-binding protein